MLSNLRFEILVPKAVSAEQSMLCNLCCAVYAVQSMRVTAAGAMGAAAAAGATAAGATAAGATAAGATAAGGSWGYSCWGYSCWGYCCWGYLATIARISGFPIIAYLPRLAYTCLDLPRPTATTSLPSR